MILPKEESREPNSTQYRRPNTYIQYHVTRSWGLYLRNTPKALPPHLTLLCNCTLTPLNKVRPPHSLFSENTTNGYCWQVSYLPLVCQRNICLSTTSSPSPTPIPPLLLSPLWQFLTSGSHFGTTVSNKVFRLIGLEGNSCTSLIINPFWPSMAASPTSLSF